MSRNTVKILHIYFKAITPLSSVAFHPLLSMHVGIASLQEAPFP